MKNTLKQFPWLPIFYSLLAITIVNLMLAFYFLTPPLEGELTTFWPIIFYNKLFFPLALFLSVGFLFAIVVYLLRKKWVAAITSFFVMLIIAFSFIGLLFNYNFTLTDSLKLELETVHLGVVGNLDGGNFLAFCSERAGKGTCDYFFTQYWIKGSPELNIEPDTKNITVSLQGITIYKYRGNFPGRCIVASETLLSEGVSGNCGSYYHGGK
jgi:hypothetical protein